MTIKEYEILRSRLDSILEHSPNRTIKIEMLGVLMRDILNSFERDSHAHDLQLEIMDKVVHS